MAAYKTGRSRTITISGKFSGEAWLGMGLVVSSFSIRVDAYWLGVATPSLTGVYGKADYVSLDAIANAQYGASDSDTDMLPMTTANSVASGTWAASIDVEEWVELTESATAPTYGGSAVDGDVPGLTTVRFFEKTKSGGSVHTEIALSDASRSVSASATGTLPGEAELTSYTCLVTLTASSNLDAQTASVEWEYLFAEGPTYSASSSGISATCGADGASIAITDALAAHNGTIAVSIAPQRAWNLSGVLRADNAAYTEPGGTIRVHRKWLEDYVEVPPSAGGYSYRYDQHSHGASCTLDSIAQASYSLHEWDDVYHWLVPPSGEAANQWRLMLRGAYYDAGTITQATTVALDGGFTFGDGGTTRLYAPNKNLSGYRYVLVQTDQAAKDVTLTIGDKEWTVQTSGSGLAIFDLCGPSNLAVDTDARDSRWPIPTDVDTVSGDGCMWGVATIASLTLTAEAGVTCNVAANAVYLSRDTWATPPAGHSFLNVVAPHLYWVPSGTANTYKRPLLRGDTDGRRSLDEADWTRVTGVPNIHTAETIEDLLDEVNASDSSVVRNVGWSAIIDTDIDVADGSAGDTWMAPDWALLNRNRNASWIEGSGIAYVNGAWRYALDVDVSSAYTLVAQVLVDKVAIYPMCGDVFGLRTGANRWEYGTTVEQGRAELRAGRYMRSAAWGLTLHENGIAHSGATVTQKELPDLTAAGSGTSDIRGEYLSGTPWGRAGYDHRIQPQVGAGATYIDRMLYGGTRLRSCFTVVPASLGCIEADGPRAWLHIGYGKRIRTYNLWGWDIVQESAEYAVDSWLKLRTDPRRGSLHMLSDDGAGTLGVWASYDGGMTGTEVATVTATSAAIEVDSERGVYVCLYENGGNVKVQQSGDAGATWTAATDALYIGAAFTGTVIDMARDARRDVLLLALESGGAISVYGSQDLGLTWELVAS